MYLNGHVSDSEVLIQLRFHHLRSNAEETCISIMSFVMEKMLVSIDKDGVFSLNNTSAPLYDSEFCRKTETVTEKVRKWQYEKEEDASAL